MPLLLFPNIECGNIPDKSHQTYLLEDCETQIRDFGWYVSAVESCVSDFGQSATYSCALPEGFYSCHPSQCSVDGGPAEEENVEGGGGDINIILFRFGGCHLSGIFCRFINRICAVNGASANLPTYRYIWLPPPPPPPPLLLLVMRWWGSELKQQLIRTFVFASFVPYFYLVPCNLSTGESRIYLFIPTHLHRASHRVKRETLSCDIKVSLLLEWVPPRKWSWFACQ